MSSIKLSTKFSYGVGAIGEASVLWLLATLAFFFYNQVIGLSGFLTGLAVSIAIFFDARLLGLCLTTNPCIFLVCIIY